jgi:hypothetical protein
MRPSHSPVPPISKQAPRLLSRLVAIRNPQSAIEGMNSKPDPRSPLNRLTEDRAAEVVDYTRTHSLKQTVDWLARDGLKTSYSSLWKWLNRRSLRQCFTEAESSANEFQDWLAKSFPKMSQRELERRASLMFQFKAVKSGDPKTYLALATARHKSKIDKARLNQRERAMNQDHEKWLAAQKTKIEAGLEALYLEVKDNAEARELFQKFKTAATRAMT